MIAAAALVTWVLTISLGLAMLVAWLATHRASPASDSAPPRMLFVHLATASVGLVVWLSYLGLGRPALLAWIAFAWLSVNNALGDTLMKRGWRQRNPRRAAASSSVSSYMQAVVDVLTFKRPRATLHAVLGGSTYFLVLFAALGW
jgi:hypothetical protein